MTLRLMIPRIRWPSLRTTIFGVTVGVSVFTLLSYIYIRRRSRKRHIKRDDATTRQYIFSSVPLGRHSAATGSYRSSTRSRKAGSCSSRTSTMRVNSRNCPLRAINGEKGVDESIELTRDNCGIFGLKALRQVIDNLEDALYDFKQFEDHYESSSEVKEVDNESGQSKSYSYFTATDISRVQSVELIQDLKVLLQEAYMVKERWKQKLILLTDMSDASGVCYERDYDYGDDDDDTASFVSAAEYIDLSHLCDLINQTPEAERYLYRTGLLEIERGNVTCRNLRTRQFGCETDSEFLAKVHCVRIAFDAISADTKRRIWVTMSLRKAAGKFLEYLDYSPDTFYVAFDDMMEFLKTPRARAMISEELGLKGIHSVNFYDVVLEFMLLDAFENLEDPPGSLLSVIGNRWLSDGFKKIALQSAILTILMAKRKYLKYSDGFLSRYFSIAAEITPALAWGFLGPDEDMSSICQKFKHLLLVFIKDIFSFNKVRYTTVEDLADDVFKLLSELADKITYEFN